MSKYEKLWRYINNCGEDSISLTFEQIADIGGVTIDHSFLQYKKELEDFGYEVKKIWVKEKNVIFIRK